MKVVTILRKLRGALGVGLTWGVLWAGITALMVVIIGLVDPNSIGPGEGPLIAGAIIGLQGLVAGGVFSAVLSLTEGRKTIRDLSLPRVGAWGLVASATLPLLTGMPVGMMWFVGLLGAGSATASVAIARRSQPLLRP